MNNKFKRYSLEEGVKELFKPQVWSKEEYYKKLLKLYHKQFLKDHYPDKPKFRIGQKVRVLKNLKEIYGRVISFKDDYPMPNLGNCLIGVDILRRSLQGKEGIVFGIQKVLVKTEPQVGPQYEIKFKGKSGIVVMAEEQIERIK